MNVVKKLNSLKHAVHIRDCLTELETYESVEKVDISEPQYFTSKDNEKIGDNSMSTTSEAVGNLAARLFTDDDKTIDVTPSSEVAYGYAEDEKSQTVKPSLEQTGKQISCQG